MNDADHPLMRWIWLLLASLAGAITALSFRPYRKMSRGDIAMAVFVGTSFAVFVAPWIGQTIFGADSPHFRVMGAVFYLTATGSNVLIPVMIRKLRAIMGLELEP